MHKIKGIRFALGWNQAELARRSGLTQATVSRIESGKVTNPGILEVKKIADAFGTTIDNLIN